MPKHRYLDISQPRLMAIVNVTPDSFSDGGQYYKNNKLDFGLVFAQIEQMVVDGAEIIDIGGESTRPGAQPVSMQEELDRVIPAVEMIVKNFDVAISVDTSNAAVMSAAIAAGAHLINDVRALSSPGALEVAASSSVTLCLMHMQGEPRTMQQDPHYNDVVTAVKTYLQQRIEILSLIHI